jgi:short-subunit dehydrogenase
MAESTSFCDRYGEWALVTGASAGIGAEFARALARRGMSIVLTARREDRLKGLAGELGVPTRVVPADLAAADGADRLADAVADLEIGVLVNNAGFGHAGRFEKIPTERLRAMVQVNCLAPVVLTSRLLPAMRQRGRGAVIVVGSIAGRQPLPLHGVYAATKAFDLFLGESLWGELRGTGVDVIVLEPGATDTEFQDVAGETSHAGESAADVVAVALAALGKQPSVVSGWANWVTANTARFLPRATMATIAGRFVARWTPQDRL